MKTVRTIFGHLGLLGRVLKMRITGKGIPDRDVAKLQHEGKVTSPSG